VSIAAMNWALRQRLANPHQQILLYVIADSADPNGLTRHCDPSYMEEHARMTRATMFRRLKELEDLGLLRRSKFYNERGAPIYEVQLVLSALVDVPIKRRGVESEEDESSEPESQPETLVEHTKVSPSAAPESHSCDCISPPLSEDSPLPPSGGVIDLEGWKDFEEEWSKHDPKNGQPILRQSIAQGIWAKLTIEQRSQATQAVRGYVIQRLGQKHPPNPCSAQSFLRESAAWPRFAAMAAKPGSAAAPGSYPSDSREAEAIRVLYAVARTSPLEHKNRVFFKGEMTLQLMAFSRAGPRSGWTFFQQGKHIAAWAEFLRLHITSARPDLVVTEGNASGSRRGIWAPWPFPPNLEGKTYEIEPDEDLMSEEDRGEEFR
jgi:hypothetical protein